METDQPKQQPGAPADKANTPPASIVCGCDQSFFGKFLTQEISFGPFALFLGFFILACFPQVLAGIQTFVVRDFGFFVYPAAYFQRQAFWNGELPLWNPYNNCGVPFLAQWNTMALYPAALIYLLAPLSWALGFFSLIHLYWGGLGMFLLARRWSGSGWGGALAGVVFAFNGLSLNMLMWPSHIATLSWMPWVVLLGERCWNQGGRKLVLAAAAGAMQMLAGGPETIMLTWVFLAAWWALQLLERVRASRGQGEGAGPWSAMLWRFPLLVLMVALLAAVQLLPFFDLVLHSQREQGYADTRWSMPPWGWANFLVPLVFGQVWNMGVFFQHDQAWTSSYYLGIGTLLLAPLALARWRQPRVLLLMLAGGLGFLLSLGEGTPVYVWVRKLLPHISFITYPIKYVTVVVFVAPLLMALGVDWLEQAERANRVDVRRRLIAIALVLLLAIAGILVWAFRFPFPTDDRSLMLASGLSRGAFLIAIAGALLAWSRARQVQLRRLFPLIALLLFWLDVVTHAPSQNPTVPAWVYQPGLARLKLAMQPQPELGASRAMLNPWAANRFISFASSSPRDNFLVKRLGYFANCNLLDAVPKVDGFFSLYPRESADVNLLLYGTTNADCPRLQDFLSVSQVTARGNEVEWAKRDSYLPMVTAGQRPVFADDRSTLQLLAGRAWQPSEVVLLPLESRARIVVSNASTARIIAARFENQRVQVEAEGAEPFFVVLSQSYYHRWRASVDGERVDLWRANYGFQAVQLPAGRHRLRLQYEDQSLKAGAGLSGMGVLLCGAWWWVGRRGADSGQGVLPQGDLKEVENPMA